MGTIGPAELDSGLFVSFKTVRPIKVLADTVSP